MRIVVMTAEIAVALGSDTNRTGAKVPGPSAIAQVSSRKSTGSPTSFVTGV